MEFPRASGVLLHPTSFPGGHGIGDLGPEAYRFVDWLASAGQRYWQVLPLGPTGYGDSPYQGFSAFAGNHLLISLDLLAEEGFVDGPLPESGNSSAVDFGAVVPQKGELLARAFRTFEKKASRALKDEMDRFVASDLARAWLGTYALFRALKDHFGGAAWIDWEPGARRREDGALAALGKKLSESIRRHQWLQFIFFRQWNRLREHAHSKGIQIIGDAPIFVSYDGSDTWGRPDLFQLDADLHPTAVAGVPPDYFSPTGQLWGNPLYRWDRQEAEGYRWWIDRVRVALACVDIVRLDHFRGFEGYWEVPAGAPTAEHGRWMPGPGERLFRAIERELGRLPIIAEDLGVITPQVDAMRRSLGLPGMRVLQFGFPDPQSPHLPHKFEPHTIVYTGTHDNDTTLGWFRTLGQKERAVIESYSGQGADQVPWSFIRMALASVAHTAIIPAQDLLDIGSEGRMNSPGRPSGNWAWRLERGALGRDLARRLKSLSQTYGRLAA